MRVYNHLERLSLAYYDTHQTGTLLSTITDDVITIQNFASSATLTILVDLLTIIGILAVMLWLNWDFALIAVGVTPFLLFFVARFKNAVKKATHEVRRRQSDIVAVVQQGREQMRAVKAFGRQELEESRLGEASQATVEAALKARRVKSLLSPIVSVTVALCTAFVLWRSASLILTGAMTVGALTVFLAYLKQFFKPVQDLAKMTNTIAQAAVGLDRIRAILETEAITPQLPDARDPGKLRGEIAFDRVAFAYDPQSPVLRDVTFTIKPGQRVGGVKIHVMAKPPHTLKKGQAHRRRRRLAHPRRRRHQGPQAQASQAPRQRCCSPTAPEPSSAQSTSPPAASTTAVS
jgi:ABC-type multidrug transport system fused ATPase/permease subunit